MTQIWSHAKCGPITAANTMAAFERALIERADGQELDVHQTADGRLVCAHDGVLTHQDGRRFALAEVTYADLDGLDVGDRSTGFMRVPLLDEVFDLLAPTQLQLNIEVKNLLHPYPGIADNLVRAVVSSGMAERIVISSFHHRLLRELRSISGAPALAALYADGLLEPWEYFSRIDIQAVHPHFSSLTEPGVIPGFQAAGIAMRPWTVNDPSMWRRFIDDGVEAIITDFPADALAVRDAAA